MELRLAGEVAIVTGGSRGIGKAIVEGLLREGAKVAAGCRHVEDLQGFGSPEQFYAATLDVTKPEQIDRFVSETVDRWGRVDMLVNNAGRAFPGTFETLTDDDWYQDIDIKLLAQVRMARRVLSHMPDGGRIVNLSAVFGKEPHPRFFASSVNRAACSAFTKALAKSTAGRGIRVNAVSIGFVHSGQWAGRPPEFFEDLIREFNIPLERFGEPAEAANAVLFLLSHAASYLTGVVLDVDGGMAAYL